MCFQGLGWGSATPSTVRRVFRYNDQRRAEADTNLLTEQRQRPPPADGKVAATGCWLERTGTLP